VDARPAPPRPPRRLLPRVSYSSAGRRRRGPACSADFLN
jgi:hypothetical protein